MLARNVWDKFGRPSGRRSLMGFPIIYRSLEGTPMLLRPFSLSRMLQEVPKSLAGVGKTHPMLLQYRCWSGFLPHRTLQEVPESLAGVCKRAEAASASLVEQLSSGRAGISQSLSHDPWAAPVFVSSRLQVRRGCFSLSRRAAEQRKSWDLRSS